MKITNFDLPRVVSVHQLVRRTGRHHGAIMLAMMRGQIRPAVMQSLEGGREVCLFPESAVEILKKPADQSATSIQ